MLIDTHSHLYAKDFDEDRKEEIALCLSNGVDKILLPNIDLETIEGMHKLVNSFPDICFPMMGLHPCSVEESTYKNTLTKMKELLFEKEKALCKYIAVGEIGIDLHWDASTLEIQKEAFATQIEWAKELNLPIVIHARSSFDEIFEVLDQHNDASLSGVFHCFTGGQKEVDKILSYGNFLMGIGGVVTFKNSGLAETIINYDLSNFILETDAPYLAPTPFRGKRNQSSYLPLIADKLSDIFEVSLEEVANITTANAKKLFRTI